MRDEAKGSLLWIVSLVRIGSFVCMVLGVGFLVDPSIVDSPWLSTTEVTERAVQLIMLAAFYHLISGLLLKWFDHREASDVDERDDEANRLALGPDEVAERWPQP